MSRRITAAIFDLDRTLIAGSSAPVFARHLAAAGLVPASIVQLDRVAAAYAAFGETPLTAATARLAATATSGWETATVARCAEAAADELIDMIQPYAPGIIAEHRDAGRRLVLATTSPEVLAAPLAERLGFDAVIATRWATEDGSFTGSIDGDIVWGRAKRDAVAAWAESAGATLARSYAYSDSYYDAPLLDAVGHPVCVNADPNLAVLARIKRWPLRHLDLPEGVLKFGGRELQRWTRPLQTTRALPNIDFDVAGIEHIPSAGPVIAVFNHRSYFDATAVGAVLGRTGRSFRFLGKKEVFDAPLVGWIAAMAGGIRVDRASGSDEPLERAIDALKAGEAVAIAPQGTIPRGPAFFDPVLKGRWGAARLAQATGAPVIPVGLWGTETVWPRSQRLPTLVFRHRPTVRVRVGDAVPLPHHSLDDDTERIMAAIVDQLPAQARRCRTPSEAELAATYPPGYRGDPDSELDRRPGTDR